MRLVIVTILFYMMLVRIRLVPIFALATPLLIASSLRAQFPFLSLDTQHSEEPQSFGKLVRRLRPQYAFVLLALLVGSSLLVLPRAESIRARALLLLLRSTISFALILTGGSTMIIPSDDI